MLASVVVLPDTEDTESTTSTGATKRRQSLTVDTDRSKRARTGSQAGSPNTLSAVISSDPSKSSDQPPDTPNSGLETQESPVATTQDAKDSGDASQARRRKLDPDNPTEERKRGKRLFGSLLGTLAQRSTSSTQKKREDIDKRQQAKLRAVEEEREGEQRRKREELDEQRVHETKRWDKESVWIRRVNEEAMAHFLQTKAEPKLYYMPWELLPEQKERIATQIAEVEKGKTEGLGESNTAAQQSKLEGDSRELQKEDLQVDQEAQTVGPNNEARTDATAPLADAENKSTTEQLDSNDAEPLAAVDEPTRETMDDNENEEVNVEAGEDPVIY